MATLLARRAAERAVRIKNVGQAVRQLSQETPVSHTDNYLQNILRKRFPLRADSENLAALKSCIDPNLHDFPPHIQAKLLQVNVEKVYNPRNAGATVGDDGTQRIVGIFGSAIKKFSTIICAKHTGCAFYGALAENPALITGVLKHDKEMLEYLESIKGNTSRYDPVTCMEKGTSYDIKRIKEIGGDSVAAIAICATLPDKQILLWDGKGKRFVAPGDVKKIDPLALWLSQDSQGNNRIMDLAESEEIIKRERERIAREKDRLTRDSSPDLSR